VESRARFVLVSPFVRVVRIMPSIFEAFTRMLLSKSLVKIPNANKNKASGIFHLNVLYWLHKGVTFDVYLSRPKSDFLLNYFAFLLKQRMIRVNLLECTLCLIFRG